MMPAAEAARRDLDPLDADVGPILRLELDLVAIPLHVVVQVPGGESRRDETDPRRAESDARKRSEDCSSDDRCTQLLPETKYAHRFHLFPYFDRVSASVPHVAMSVGRTAGSPGRPRGA